MTHQLIAINRSQISGETVETVNARDLHKNLGVSKDFSDWVKAQIKRAMLSEGVDYIVVPQKGENGRMLIDYHLTIDAGKHIAMLSGTEKGRAVRDYFIECERRAKTVALPAINDPVLAAQVRTLIEVDAIKTEQKRQAIELAKVQETLAVVEARTQPENKHFTVMGWANLQGQKVDIGLAAKLGKRCAELSRDQGIPIGDVSDPRFGKVHSYHETILQAVFDRTNQAA